MRSPTGTSEDRPAGLTGAIPWRVTSVAALPGYRLEVSFADGTRGKVDCSRLIRGKRAGVFECLRDERVFVQVGVDHGAVTWPGELDLAPDAMYDAIRADGTWRVE